MKLTAIVSSVAKPSPIWVKVVWAAPSLEARAIIGGRIRKYSPEDGTTISWKILSTALSFAAEGETVTIAGIRANASMVGDGDDVTAVVRVNGEAVHSGSLKLADVKTATGD